MTPAGRRLAFLAPALLATGAAALVHETAWLRCLVPALGAGALPAAAVSAGVLLGLGLGAAIGGRLADRTRAPLFVLAGAEGTAAAMAFALPPVATALSGPLADPWPLLLAVLALTAVSLPLGASLPAALRVVAPAREAAGSAFRLLYGVNTLGAVLGVLAAAAWLVEALGNRGAIRVAAAAQAVVAGALLLVGRRWRSLPAPFASERAVRAPVPRRLLAAAALAGAAGLVVQVAWVRRLLPVVGYSTQSFAVVLATSLLGIALGSLLLGPRRGAPNRETVTWILIVAAVPVAFLPDAVAGLDAWAASRLLASGAGAGMRLLVGAAAAAFVVVPSTVFGAAALPWLVRAAAPDPDHGGRATGALLAANAGAAAAAALLTATLWIPAAGSAGALRGAAGLYLLAAALLARRAPRAVAVFAGVLLLLQPWIRPVPDDAAFEGVGATWRPGAFAPADAVRRFAKEGPVATVVVRDREGERELWVDAKIVASTFPTDRLHLALLGHLPMALSPTQPRRVAVIGLGTGMTARAVASWSPERLDIYELEPAVAAAAASFADEGGGVPEGATVIEGDGRRAIRRTETPYDVITSDPIHPGVAGSAWLYSLEHWQTLAQRAPVVAQWLPLYQMRVGDVRLVVRTFAAAFACPYAFLSAEDVILIGCRQPIHLDEARLRRRLEGPPGRRLAAFGLDAPGRLLGLLVQGPDGLRLFGGGGVLNTDDRLLLEFSAGRSLDVEESGHLAGLLALDRTPAASLLDGPPSTAFEKETAEARTFRRAQRSWVDGDDPRAERLFRRLADAHPDDVYARVQWRDAALAVARTAADEGWDEKALERVKRVLAVPSLLPRQRLDAVEILFDAGWVEPAREALDALPGGHAWPRAKRLAREIGSR